jgi:hypothetical protein
MNMVSCPLPCRREQSALLCRQEKYPMADPKQCERTRAEGRRWPAPARSDRGEGEAARSASNEDDGPNGGSRRDLAIGGRGPAAKCLPTPRPAAGAPLGPPALPRPGAPRNPAAPRDPALGPPGGLSKPNNRLVGRFGRPANYLRRLEPLCGIPAGRRSLRRRDPRTQPSNSGPSTPSRRPQQTKQPFGWSRSANYPSPPRTPLRHPRRGGDLSDPRGPRTRPLELLALGPDPSTLAPASGPSNPCLQPNNRLVGGFASALPEPASTPAPRDPLPRILAANACGDLRRLGGGVAGAVYSRCNAAVMA